MKKFTLKTASYLVSFTFKIDGVAPLFPVLSDATPTIGQINPFEIIT